MLCLNQKILNGHKVGIVFGTFAPLHQGHLDLIYRAKKECDAGCIVVVCGFDGDKGEPLFNHRERYTAVAKFFQDDNLIHVCGINDTDIGAPPYPDGWKQWMDTFNKHYQLYAPTIKERVWYVGEECYKNDLETMWNETAILVDRIATNPISATKIRNNPIKYWNKITPPFRKYFSYNVLVCGTASEGKTTLVKDLSKYFNTVHSVEYARIYMAQKGLTDKDLNGEDFEQFLLGQYSLYNSNTASCMNNGVFFADTDSMVTKMYAQYYAQDPNLNLTNEEFEKISKLADLITNESRWNKIYLVCPKGIFVDDGVRYMGHSSMEDRNNLYNILCQNIKDAGLWDKVTILDGGYWKNFEKIVNDTRKVFENE